MIFQDGTPSLGDYTSLFILAALLIGDIFLLKLFLIMTKAESNRNLKWVAISFGIQYGLVFFICLPLFLIGLTGGFDERGPDPGMLIPIIVLSIFIDLNLINVIHKIGIKRSILVGFFISAPIITSMFILGPLLANPPF
ncbi:MAG: hypothetical protein ACFFAO_17510 [Candidatus Hermodarchaeota archaeon]